MGWSSYVGIKVVHGVQQKRLYLGVSTALKDVCFKSDNRRIYNEIVFQDWD